MALTFKTAALLSIIEGITAAIADDKERYQQEVSDAKADAVVKWSNANIERVRELRDYLTKRLKAGVPPYTTEAIRIMGEGNRARYDSGIALFNGGHDNVNAAQTFGYQRLDELNGLAAVLRAHQLDTITAHQLKELGTHPKDLARLFRAAAAAGVGVSS